MSVNIIVAVGNYVVDKGWPIGKKGNTPWYNKADLKWFKEMTTGHPVIMGRKTWDNLPHALYDRTNIVVTHTTGVLDWAEQDNDVYSVSSVEDAIKLAKEKSDEDIFIIGGATIYKYALEHNLVDKVYIDFLAEEVPEADVFFPDIVTDNKWEEEGRPIEIEPRKAYALTYVKTRGQNNHVDEQYLKLVNEIIEKGEEKDTRAGKTRSLFGKQLRFNLKEGLPMLTTKKMFSKGVIYELLWFLKGDTNIKYLVDNGVHIWDDDAYRYYLELCKKYRVFEMAELLNGHMGYVPSSEFRSLSEKSFLKEVTNKKVIYFENCDTNEMESYTFGDLNNVYGYQWTKWGGHNQIQEVIDKLKTNPDDRRMIVSAWNVEDIPNMALPPCHFCCQFYTKKMSLEERQKWVKERRGEDVGENIELLDEWNVPTRKLSCMWHQRSVDIPCGLPFNITSYATMTYMIAQCCNMDVDELIFDGGDCHVYENQIETYKKEQKDRNPHMYALPKLVLNSKITNIFDFKYEDIKIEGYNSYPSIKYPLSVGL